jgi:putative toxin-antitoxin system antitoxin component (TIGR02293 family)
LNEFLPAANWRTRLCHTPEAIMAKARSKPAPPANPLLEMPYPTGDPMAQVGMVREGVTWETYRGVMDGLGLNDLAAAGVLHIPPRTLARRKGGRLDAQESERLLRLMRLVAQATEVLGTREKAMRWLALPNNALGRAAPQSLLDTDIGTQAAEAVLARIAFGVFS